MEKSQVRNSETFLNFNHIKHQGSRRPPGHPRQSCDEDPATDSATFCSRVSRASDCTLTYTRQNGCVDKGLSLGAGVIDLMDQMLQRELGWCTLDLDFNWVILWKMIQKGISRGEVLVDLDWILIKPFMHGMICRPPPCLLLPPSHYYS